MRTASVNLGAVKFHRHVVPLYALPQTDLSIWILPALGGSDSIPSPLSQDFPPAVCIIYLAFSHLDWVLSCHQYQRCDD